MIPKILHLYWGRNKPLSWMRYLTVKSFARWHPDWEIAVHHPSCANIILSPHKDWLGELKHIEQVYFVAQPDSVWDELEGIEDSKYKEIHRSDFLRWHLLGTVGGVWSDFDIFYLRPIDSIFSRAAVHLIKYDYIKKQVYPIGFLASSGEKNARRFFKEVEGNAITSYKPNKFQCIGSELLRGMASSLNGRVNYLPSISVYPFGVQQRGFTKLYKTDNSCVPLCTVGVHWFGGHPSAQEIEKKLTPETMPNLGRAYKMVDIMRRGLDEV